MFIHIANKLKYSLITVLCITIAVSAYFLLDPRKAPDNSKKTDKSVNINASMFLKNVNQTAQRDGKQEWKLNASSATFFEADKRMIINDPVVTFYTKQSDNVHLTAKEGEYNTDTSKIKVNGNVIIKNTLYELNTEKLHYEPDTRIIQSTTSVTISSKSFNIQADKIIINLNTNKAELIGNVKGSIRGKLLF